MKAWLDRHPGASLDGLAYYGSCPASIVGIEDGKYPPTGGLQLGGAETNGPAEDRLQAGWYALSVNYLYGRSRQYRYFLQLEPEAMAGYSIYIYCVTQDDVERVCREVGSRHEREPRNAKLRGCGGNGLGRL